MIGTTHEFARAIRDTGSSAWHRQRRHKKEIQRLREKVGLLLAADHRLRYRGVDHAAIAVATQLGFETHDLHICRVALKTRTATAIIAPARIWYSGSDRERLFTLRRMLRSRGTSCVVVCAGLLDRQPRLSNSELLAATSRVEISASERMAVELLVINEGAASLNDCAHAIRANRDPFGAVLGLVYARRFDVDIDRPIDPFTMIRPANIEGLLP